MSKLHFSILLMYMCAIFYFIGKWLPWRFGLFAIERYPYGEPYQFLFLFFLSVIFFVSRNFIINKKLLVIIALGFLFGSISSLMSYLLSYSFFYYDSISSYGLLNIIDMSINEPFSTWFQIIILSFMLLGWLYGIICSICIYSISSHNKNINSDG